MKQAFLLAAALLAAPCVFAQVAIDQNKALAGGITPGDAPGFPITLSQPGNYKLTGPLTVPANTKGIVITAQDVTLDLNGFTLAGPVKCSQPVNFTVQPVICTQQSGNNHGIEIATNTTGTVIRNGTVRGFNGIGILTTEGETLQNVHVTQNGHGGIGGSMNALTGARILDAVVDLNYGFGISVHAGLVDRSNIASNGGDAVSGGYALVVRNSLVRSNYGVSLSGVSAGGTVSSNNRFARSNVTSLGGNAEQANQY